MEKIEQHLKSLQEKFGEPREGFAEYFKKCTPVPVLTTAPKVCKYYETPEKVIIHQIMIQPFYDSRTMVARPADVLVTSYPKTGTTWIQEITYLVAHDADIDKALSAPSEWRVPFLEVPYCGIKGIENYESPRVLTSHMPYELLPKSFTDSKTKIIYITRNPRDTIVSFFHFQRMLAHTAYAGTFEQFVDSFCEERIFYSSFARNVLSYWNRRNDENVLFLFYEDLKKDLKGNVMKIAKFLNKSFSEDQIRQIVEHSTFNSMKKNPTVNSKDAVKIPDTKTEFVRKGITGDWKNYFTSELVTKVDAYVEKHFKGTGIEFQY